ncbi:hypothetical protein [Candidatus Magnetobacterium casense]|uniref:Uncharacterized protein n=1 Tax=Candidatus Magnetobacterium casense TaxID=1455061 RepID=A0ABS6S0M9_9BACT|nr:hypothetical protein [Candidatus Magnetobacterium casensis]MBV6342410.1 hypothetical protein [Candidatus Magnetobacterium casensis]
MNYKEFMSTMISYYGAPTSVLHNDEVMKYLLKSFPQGEVLKKLKEKIFETHKIHYGFPDVATIKEIFEKNKGDVLSGIGVVESVNILDFLPKGTDVKSITNTIEVEETERQGRVAHINHVAKKIRRG